MKINDQIEYNKALNRLQFLTNCAFLTPLEEDEKKELNEAIAEFDANLMFECYARLN